MADLDAELGHRLERLSDAVPVAPWLGHVERSPVAARRQLRMAWMTPLVVITIAVVGTAMLDVSTGPRPGASSDASPGAPSARPNELVHASATDGEFLLEIESPKAWYAVGESIDIRARLTYLGQDQVVSVTHGFGSPMKFGVVEPINGLTLSPTWRLSCETTRLAAGQPLERPFEKSGGFEGTDPRAGAWQAFLAEPLLILPVGAWHPYVQASFGIGDCGTESRSLRAEIGIEVVADQSTGEEAVHIVNVDGPLVEVLMDGSKVAAVACGGSAALIATGAPRGLPWTLELRTADGQHLETLRIDGPLPWGVLIRGTEVLNGPWPMSYGPAPEQPCGVGSDEPVEAANSDGPYEVKLHSPRRVYYESDIIDVTGAFSYAGEAGREVWGLMLGFSIDEPVHGIDITAIHPTVCGLTNLAPGHRVETPFTKGGAVSGDDPLYDQKLAYLRDPVFRLPPGTWHLRYGGSLFEGECGPDISQRSFSTMIEIIVLPEAERP